MTTLLYEAKHGLNGDGLYQVFRDGDRYFIKMSGPYYQRQVDAGEGYVEVEYGEALEAMEMDD